VKPVIMRPVHRRFREKRVVSKDMNGVSRGVVIAVVM
jgi:hypothetical protein